MLFKQVLQLGDILDDDGHEYIPGTHGCQQLVKIIRQAHIGKLIHEKMDRNRQGTLLLIIRQPEKLFKSTAIDHADQKIEAHIVVGNQGEQRHFFLAQGCKFQFIRTRQRRNAGKVELFQSRRQSDLNGLQGLGRAGMVVLVILHGNVVGVAHFQT